VEDLPFDIGVFVISLKLPLISEGGRKGVCCWNCLVYCLYGVQSKYCNQLVTIDSTRVTSNLCDW